MNEFWIFLVIAGIIISFANKDDKRGKKSQTTPSPESTSEEDARAEMQRQLRKLLRERTTHEAQQPVTYTITPSATKQRNTPDKVQPKAQPKVETQEPPKATPSKIKPSSGDNSQISGIIEDFTMEKAVIYAEILKPKYEEY